MHLLRSLAVSAVLILAGASAPAVNVAYAGSLVTPMERAVGPAFARACSCEYQGEGKGSVALGHLIEAGAKNPDVFISADTAVLDSLMNGPSHAVTWYATFAGSRMVLGYSRKSAFAKRFEQGARGRITTAALLETPGLRIGRTDPKVDPKGYRTLLAVQLLAKHFADPALPGVLGDPENPAQIYAEETLLVRLEEGDTDVAFLYSTEAQSRHIPMLELPEDANLGHPALSATYRIAAVRIGATVHRGAPITYALSIPAAARNPAGASAFVRYITRGPGRDMLRSAGLTFIAPQITGNRAAARAALSLHE